MKQFYALLLFSSLCNLSCSKSDITTTVAPTPVAINKAPTAFSAKATLNADGKTIKLSWTKA